MYVATCSQVLLIGSVSFSMGICRHFQMAAAVDSMLVNHMS